MLGGQRSKRNGCRKMKNQLLTKFLVQNEKVQNGFLGTSCPKPVSLVETQRISQGMSEHLALPVTQTFTQGLLSVCAPKMILPAETDKLPNWGRILGCGTGSQGRAEGQPRSLIGHAISPAPLRRPGRGGGVNWACLAGWGQLFSLDPSRLPTPALENTGKSKLKGNCGIFMCWISTLLLKMFTGSF